MFSRDLFGNYNFDKSALASGFPYQGSKRGIAGEIISKILSSTDKRERFVDAFCGGGAIAYNVQCEFKDVLANDINRDLIDLHLNFSRYDLQYFAENIYSIKNTGYEFVKIIDESDLANHEKYLLKLIGSFGNNCKDDLWGGDNVIKYQISYDLYRDPEKITDIISDILDCKKIDFKFSNDKNLVVKYSEYKKLIGLYRNSLKFDQQQLQRLQQLERLQRLQRLERLERKIKFVSKRYNEIEYNKNDVVYFDPPYENTAEYKLVEKFDNKEFEKFAAGLTCPVFISEYKSKIDGFTNIFEIEKQNTMSAKGNFDVTEFLHWNKIS